MERLEFAFPYRLVWQSRVGPSAWMGQETEAALRGLARLGRKHVVLVPIAFTTEHVETLHELDIQYAADLAKEVGMVSVRRASAPNDHPLFIQVKYSTAFSAVKRQLICSLALVLFQLWLETFF